MKKTIVTRFVGIIVVTLCFCAGSTALAQRATEDNQTKDQSRKDINKERRPVSTQNNLFVIMNRELSLTRWQQTKLKQLINDRDEALRKWNKKYGAKAEELKKAVEQAKASGDEEAYHKAIREYNAFVVGRDTIKYEFDKAVQEILTNQQQIAWEGYLMYEAQISRFTKVNPTDDQKKKVRALCDVAVKAISKLDSKDPDDREMIRQIQAQSVSRRK